MNIFKKFKFKTEVYGNTGSSLRFEIKKRGDITFDDVEVIINVAKELIKNTGDWVYSCDFVIDPKRRYDEVQEKYVNDNETSNLKWNRKNFELSTGRRFHIKTENNRESTWLEISSHGNLVKIYGQVLPDKLHALFYDHLKEAL